MPKELTARIPELIREMDANMAGAESVCAGLSHDRFNWKPSPERWSVAQCLNHLVIVNRGDIPALRESVRAGRAAGLTGAGPFRYGSLSAKFAASQDLPVKRRFKAPRYFNPTDSAPLDGTLAEYLRISNEIRAIAKDADGLDLARVKTPLNALPAFIRGLLKMPLGARFALLTAHDRRHLWQASEVRRDPGFPA